jgi:hypothetical protein
LRQLPVDSSAYSSQGGELALAGRAVLDLMQAVFRRGLPFRFRARGCSMEPLIADGDVISLTPLVRGEPHLGDVVAFIRPGPRQLVVHRVIAVRGNLCSIRGDSGCDDGMIGRDHILGRVLCVERGARTVRGGLGPERFLIAFLSRAQILQPTLWRIGALRHFLRRERVR